MKKTKKIILFMLCCVVMLPMVNAAKASNPTSVPAGGTSMYANIDKKANGFDFNKIQFKKDSQTITGATKMQKIYLAETYDKDGLKSEFTAYCLDASKKYPDYNVFDEEDIFRNLVKRALYNSDDPNWKTKSNTFFNQENNENYTNFVLKAGTNSNYTIDDGKTPEDIVAAYNSGSNNNEFNFDVNLSKVLISSSKAIDKSDCTVTTESNNENVRILKCFNTNEVHDIILYINDVKKDRYTINDDSNYTYNHEEGSLKLNLELLSIDFDNADIKIYPIKKVYDEVSVNLSFDSVEYAKYKTTELNKSNIGNYSKALWIIENSYPVLSLKDSLALAGADYDKLLTELKTLTGESTVTENMADDYVYSTVQYAIWYVTGGKDANGNQIGNTLVGSDQLAKLFSYLIAGAGNGYVEPTATLTINEPKKALYKETKENYIHGPYTVSSGFDKSVNVALNIENENKDGILLVDSEGKEITSGVVKPGEKFYIVITKESKVTNAKVSATATGYVYDDSARLYSPNFSLFQNLLTGRKKVEKSAKVEVEVLVNAKTGAENIAILLVITMISFSIGYLVLGYKNNPVEL